MSAMTYDLFLDDERIPAYTTPNQVVVCRDFPAFKHTILNLGFPESIHLDHDLGTTTGDGSDAMKWLVDFIIDYGMFFPIPEIDFYIHSQNPEGERAMRGYIYDIQRLREMQNE